MNTKSLRPITHWLIQRGTAILILSTIIFAPFWFVLIALNILVFWHLYLGLEEILADYVHNEIIRYLFLILLKVLIIISVKYVFVLFVL
jgi:succinate dehydrogenase hydrophobic anchor subunit